MITINGNQFLPGELSIPADQTVKITVKNMDANPAEDNEIILFVGPLKAGSYGYFDDFHRGTTEGTIAAK